MSKLSKVWVLLLVGGLILSGCGPATVEPAAQPTRPSASDEVPTAEPTRPSAGDEVAPPDPVRARDAALAYLAEAYGDRAPAPGLTWTAEETTPQGLVGSTSFQYRADGWLVAVSFPVVAPEATIYQVVVTNEDTGFAWEGEVDAWLGVSAAHPGVVSALDAVVAYLAENYGQELPAPGMGWTEEHTKPEELVGAEFYEYRLGAWLIAVSYPVVAPEAMVYQVVVTNESTGFAWEGEVDAAGQVTESAGPQGERETAPQVSAADLAELAKGNGAFAFDLYQLLREKDGNLFYSPYSISLALAMTYAGARGETEAQMAEALHFLLPQQSLHPAFNGLDLELAARGEGAEGKDGQGFRLNIVNALWGQEGYKFLPEFLDLLARNYGAGMRLVDFVNAAEEARVTINDWVAEQTEGRIEDLIPQGAISELTRLVLTNAIYFNAAWAEPFEPEVTADGIFHLLDGGEVTVPMMAQSKSFPYAEGEGYQAIELPYDGYELSMVILLPAEGEFEAFEGSLDAGQVEAILADLAHRQVAVTLPVFEFESEFSLVEALSALGMPVAFSTDADFSGMTGGRDLFISEVIHKAFVSVDEAGTEAAAATAVVMDLTAAPQAPVTFTADRPFLFFIRDIQTGAVLFVGRVMDPSS